MQENKLISKLKSMPPMLMPFEVEELLGITSRQLKKLENEGLIASTKIGAKKHRRYSNYDVQILVNSQEYLERKK